MVPTCFGLRPSSGNLQLRLAKFILTLKHSVRLRRNLLCGGVAACPSMACVLCRTQHTVHTSLTLSQMSYDNDGFTRSEKKVGCLGYVGYFGTKT
jgi:hypothetical protein